MPIGGQREIGFRFTGDVKSLDQASGTARRRLDRVTEGSDRLATQSGTLTGAMGALGSGLELAGLESSKLAFALQGTALATDFASGIGDVFAVTLQSVSLKAIGARAKTVALTTATKAQTAATRALNIVLRANPIGIVITVLVALGAALVVAYKKSQTFRNIVQGAMRGVQRAFGWVLDRGRDVLGWFRALPGRIGSAISTVASAITAPFRAAFSGIRNIWNSTIGGRGFDVPSWVPFGLGGRSFRIPFLQRGGIARRNMPHVVGEAGPEIFMPGVTGRVLPNRALEAALGTTIIENHIEIGGEVVRVVRQVVRGDNRTLKRRALAGSGAAR